MGRIKTQRIKRVTLLLFNKYGDKFTKDFNQNKIILNQLATIPSKKIRNTIAGYLTRKAQQNV